MYKNCFIRTIAVLIILCMLCTSLPMYGYAVPHITQEVVEQDGISRVVPPFVSLDYVKWGDNISETIVKKAIRKGQSLHLEDMGLNPTACANGTVNNSFSWTSANPNIASVDAATGRVTALAVGIVNITGTSPFGSGHGQLTLTLYVIDNELVEVSMIALWGDTIFHNTGFSSISRFMADLGIEADETRVYGGERPTDRMTVEMFATYLETSRIFYFRGHGSRTSVQIDKNGNTSTWFSTSYIDPLPTNIFSYCELVLYSACSTAEGGENATNLVTATKDHGAETVVGFQVPVVNSEMDYWDQFFFEALAKGETVMDACECAWKEIEKYNDKDMLNANGEFGSSRYIVAGNKYNTLESRNEEA